MSEYKNIRVKKEVWESLNKAAKLLNEKGKIKFTLAGLVTMLAEAYDTQMDEATLAGNENYWAIQGVPVILDSDSAKHYRELKQYFPEHCSNLVNSFIRSEAMDKRYEIAGVPR